MCNETIDIFLESAYFNPVSVRKTAKMFALNTDASFRFERGVDPNLTDYALKRTVLLIQELACGTGDEVSNEIVKLMLLLKMMISVRKIKILSIQNLKNVLN